MDKVDWLTEPRKDGLFIWEVGCVVGRTTYYFSSIFKSRATRQAYEYGLDKRSSN